MSEEVQKPEAQDEGGVDRRISELSREAASYRSQRNLALRKAHAYETMLKAHSVDVSAVTEASLETLPINEGKVDGEWKYKPPSITVPKTQQHQRADTGTRGLSLDDVRNMSVKQINDQWSEVHRALSGGT